MQVTPNRAERVAWRPQRAHWARPAAAVVCLLALAAGGNCRTTTRTSADRSALQIGVALPRAMDPTIGLRALLNSLTTESLVGIGWDGRPTKKLAEEWGPLPEDHGIWLRLAGNLRFHDGTPVTAPAVKAILEEEAATPERPLSYGSITRISTPNDQTLEIRLSRPEALLLSDLVESRVDHTGPYRIVEQKENVQLAAFQDYYRGRPQTEVLHLKPYVTQRNTWAAFMRGEINAVHDVSPAAIEFVEQESSVRTYRFLRAYYSLLTFNMRHPVLARADVRQALSQSINREEIVKLALRGRGEPADGPVWPYHWAYSTGQKTHSYNPDAARLRLDSAGFRTPTERQSGRMPSRLRFRCLIWTDDPRYESMALVIQKQLFDVGVDMEIEAVPVPEFVARMKVGRFDSLLMEFTSGRSLNWLYGAFHSSHPIPNSPLTGYRAADALLDRLRGSTSDQEIRESVGQLQRTFYEDPPAIFIAWPYTSRAVSTAFAVPEDLNGDVLSTIWQWRAQPQVARR